MFYKLNEKVYPVKGRSCFCIYDVLHNRLQSGSLDLYDLIERSCKGESLSKDEQEVISYLKDEGILVSSEATSNIDDNNIEELFDFPRHLDYAWIEVTNLCNLKCTHCYNEFSEIQKRSMTLDEFRHVVDELEKCGIKAIQMIGGEPFLIEENVLFDMMDYASERFENFELFFNGTLVEEKHLLKIRERYDNYKIALSLHSFIEEEHEKLTQVKGSYSRTISTIKLLQKLEMPFRYVGVYSSQIDIGEEQEFGPPYRRDYIRLAGRANMKHYDSNLLRERLITEHNFEFENLEESLKIIHSEYCFSNYIYVSSNLDLYPCVMERRLKHGNLRNRSLTEVLDKALVNFSKKRVNGCKYCEYRYLCKDCRPDSLNESPYEKPWYCTYDEENGKWTDAEDKIKTLLAEYGG